MQLDIATADKKSIHTGNHDRIHIMRIRSRHIIVEKKSKKDLQH